MSASFNPAAVDYDKEEYTIPAKIWELLRRNDSFRALVDNLNTIENELITLQEEDNKEYHIQLQKFLNAIGQIPSQNPFARSAAEWLVPEPVIHFFFTRYDKSGGVEEDKLATLRPQDLKRARKNWTWLPQGESRIGIPNSRGPVIIFLDSNRRKFKDDKRILDEWRDWSRGCPLFSYESPWPETPFGFRQQFAFHWRHFDSRPSNDVTGCRGDSPHPHEISYPDPLITDAEYRLVKSVQHDSIKSNYRVFAIPKSILTINAADKIAEWLRSELKKGSSSHGGLLSKGLLREANMMGSSRDWQMWLQLKEKIDPKSSYVKTTDDRRRIKYMENLIESSYPHFDISILLKPALHRHQRSKRKPS